MNEPPFKLEAMMVRHEEFASRRSKRGRGFFAARDVPGPRY
jgi:hypothetical protein